jgi:hypothetical protein
VQLADIKHSRAAHTLAVHTDQFILRRALDVARHLFPMSDQSQWPDADVDKRGEIAAAQDAQSRLLEALRQLETDTADLLAPSARLQRHASKRLSAVQVLQRHAVSTIARFAFVDGEPVDEPDPGLLTAFYSDPMDSVSSRYCWALLAAEGDRGSLSNVILATVAELQAFLGQQEEATQRTADNPMYPVASDHSHVWLADRLAYRHATLNRLMFVQRHVTGPAAATTELEDEIERVCNDTEEAADVVRQIGWARLSKP